MKYLLVFCFLNIASCVLADDSLACVRVDIDQPNYHFSLLLYNEQRVPGDERRIFSAKVCSAVPQDEFKRFLDNCYVMPDNPGLILIINKLEYPTKQIYVFYDSDEKFISTFTNFYNTQVTHVTITSPVYIQYGNETICEPNCVADFLKSNTTLTAPHQNATTEILIEPVILPSTTITDEPKSWQNDYYIAIIIAAICLPLYITMYLVYRRLTRNCLRPVNV